MQKRSNCITGPNPILLLTSLGCVVAMLVGCSTLSETVEIRTHPPDLEHMPDDQVQSAMWVIAAEIEQLETLIEDPAEIEKSTRRMAVIATLDRMRIAAKTLDRPGRSTQHPVLNEHLGTFVGRIERARRAASGDPPNYFLAGTLAGSCYLCHGRAYAMQP